MRQMIAALERRLINMVAAAIIRRVEDGVKIQEVQVDLLADETATGLQRLQEYGFTSVPLDGATALALFLGGNRDHGVVIATDDGRHRPSGLAAGDVAAYDSRGQTIKLTATGIEIDTALPITVTAPSVTFDVPDVQITGNLTVLTGTTPLSLATFRGTYNTHTHPENDNGGPTSAPNELI